MRDYDDQNIRLYTPVLQRVIILLAVIIAVPVVMWTITTVVRTYFAPPKVPTFQRMTENQPSGTVSDAMQAAPAAPASAAPAAPAAAQTQAAAPSGQVADAGTTASDAHPALIEIKKPADGQPQAGAGAPAATPQIAVATQSPSAQPPTPAAQPMPMPAAPSQPMAVPASAASAAPAAPAAASPPMGAMQHSAASTGTTTAPGSNIAWPNPNTNAPPQVGTDNGAKETKAATGPSPAPPPTPASGDTASEALPSGQPIAGRIPLPPRRPMQFAMAQTGGAIPLPRPRPADAPAATPSAPVETPDSGYEPGMEPGHY